MRIALVLPVVFLTSCVARPKADEEVWRAYRHPPKPSHVEVAAFPTTAAAFTAGDDDVRARKQREWERWYWSQIDAGRSPSDASAHASELTRDPESARRFAAKTPEQLSESRDAHETEKRVAARVKEASDAVLETWKDSYEGLLGAGYSPERAAQLASRYTGDSNSQTRYEEEQLEIRLRVRAKERQYWYDAFRRGGYTSEEAAFKADEMVGR